MKTTDIILVIIAILIVCSTIIYTLKCNPNAGGTLGISVQGEAVAQVQPDTLTLNFSVQDKDDTSLGAQTKIDETSKKFITLIKDLGVDAKRIQTSNYSVYQNYIWSSDSTKQIPDGFQATQSITVTLDGEGFIELGQKVLSVAPTVGNININSTNFSLKNRSSGQSEIREMAVEAAYKKAKQLAKASGVKLGEPIVITETTTGGDFYFPRAYNTKADLATNEAEYNSVGLEAGTSEVRVQVNITYKIK